MKINFQYVDTIDATQVGWKSKLKAHLDKGQQVVVFNLQHNQIKDCQAFAVEHDFDCIVEDSSVLQTYPKVQPEFLGFVPCDETKRISK